MQILRPWQLYGLLTLGAMGCTGRNDAPVLAHTDPIPGVAVASLSSTAPASDLGPDGVAKQNFLDTYVDRTAIMYSYHAHNGDYVDCVDIMRQPAMLAPGATGSIASPPPAVQTSSAPPNGALPGQLDGAVYAATADENGNLRHCPEQTVPIRRILPATLAAAPSLNAFLSKYPGGLPSALTRPVTPPPPSPWEDVDGVWLRNWRSCSSADAWLWRGEREVHGGIPTIGQGEGPEPQDVFAGVDLPA